jgi:peptidoglycan/LPS O-acetylase OafA/YrhL
MMPVRLEMYLAIFMLTLTVVAGVFAGALTCFVQRSRWGWKAALIDAVIAAVVASIYIYVALEIIDVFFGGWASIPQLPLVLVVVATVVLRHLMPPRAQRDKRTGS